ncbi:hypothetical protein ACKWTF_014547 [Chironomus riparius]
MNSRLILMLVLTFCFCALINTAPMETQIEEETSSNIEKTYNELQNLKRVVRQCPFSGGGGFPGGAGGGPDLNQMISIARTVLSMLDGANAGGSGGFGGAGGMPGLPGGDGTNTQVDSNVLGRLMRGRRG